MKQATRKVAVFGAGGFVGSAVCRQALRQGLDVVGFGRSATVPQTLAATDVTWKRADALDPRSFAHNLGGVDAVVVAIGSPPLPFVDADFQRRANGKTAQTVAAEAARAGVKRFVFVSASMPPFTPAGYAEGKRAGEQAALEFASSAPGRHATVLRPAAISGTRQAGSFHLPLWLVLAPLSFLFRLLHVPLGWLMRAVPALDNALLPPVHVRSVAKAAVDACVQEDPPLQFTVVSNADMLAMDKD